MSLNGGAPTFDLSIIFLVTLLIELAILFYVALGSARAFDYAPYTTIYKNSLVIFYCYYLILESYLFNIFESPSNPSIKN